MLNYLGKYKKEDFFVLLNAGPKSVLESNLPEGEWDVVVDENSAGVTPLRTVSESVSVSNGFVPIIIASS